MAKFVCTRTCYPGRFCREGDVVDDSVAAIIPSCFRELKSTTKRAIEAEVEDLGLAEKDETVQPISNVELRNLPPINGGGPKEEAKPTRRTRKTN